MEKTPIKTGSYVILNDCDCPYTKLVAKVTSVDEEKNHVKAYYICKATNMVECGGRLDLATDVKDFGVELNFVGNTVTGIQVRPSVAAYPDGVPRDWQPGSANPTQGLRKLKSKAKAA